MKGLRIGLIVAVVAVVAILASGCGSGGGSTSSGSTSGDPKSLTKSEFTTQVNNICGKVPRFYAKTLEKLKKGKSLTQAEVTMKAAVPPLYTAIKQMEALTPPSGEEQELEEIMAALESAAKGLEREPATRELVGPKTPFAEFQKLTKEFGFGTCSRL